MDPVPPRFAPYDDLEEDEELPDYDHDAAPAYDELGFDTPIASYHLRCVNRKLQMLVPFGPSPSLSYSISHGTALNPFSKKPDLSLTRVSPDQKTEDVSAIRFHNNGPLPWCPRASFKHGASTYHMESRNFSDWTYSMGGQTLRWHLSGRPISLVLSQHDTILPVARFTYSERGTLATKGAEAGKLEIYRDALTTEGEGVEKIMCGLLVAMEHFKRMGRHYWNDGKTLHAEALRSQLPPRTGALGSFSYM